MTTSSGHQTELQYRQRFPGAATLKGSRLAAFPTARAELGFNLIALASEVRILTAAVSEARQLRLEIRSAVRSLESRVSSAFRLLLSLLLVACTTAPRAGRDPAAGSGGAPGEPDLPGVGSSAKMQGWEVVLLAFGPYEGITPGLAPASSVGGSIVAAHLRIRNLQSRPDDFTPSDFVLRAGDGRQFGPAAQTAQIERGLGPRETLQPGQTTERRVIFEVPPDARELVLEALELEFSVPALRP